MRYSSRKFTNDKVITTACNFWRQIACSFQVMSGNILFLGNKIFEIPPFFQTRPGDLGENVRACSLRFSALNINRCRRGLFFDGGFSAVTSVTVFKKTLNQTWMSKVFLFFYYILLTFILVSAVHRFCTWIMLWVCSKHVKILFLAKLQNTRPLFCISLNNKCCKEINIYFMCSLSSQLSLSIPL